MSDSWSLTTITNIFTDIYATTVPELLLQIHNDVNRLHYGDYPGFQASDSGYHGLQHTLETSAASARILGGIVHDGGTAIPAELFELTIIAALFHDIGYIKDESDHEGTGGKHTFHHVGRSVNFARTYLQEHGISEESINIIENMIWCTRSESDLSRYEFPSETARMCGYAVGTADLTCQMSDPDYAEKLEVLYTEFAEAYEHEGIDKLKKAGHRVFGSSEELLTNTPVFYEKWVKPRFNMFGSLERYLADEVDRITINIRNIASLMETV